MKNRVFNFASVFSLVLAFLMCARWARSYFVADMIFYTGPTSGDGHQRIGGALCEYGFIGFDTASKTDAEATINHMVGGTVYVPKSWFEDRSLSIEPADRAQIRDQYAFGGMTAFSYARVFGARFVTFPPWLPIVLFLIVPAIWFRQNRLVAHGRGFQVST